MKLDLSAAWDQAVTLVAANREVVLVLAGVFFFFPYLLFSLFIPPVSARVTAGAEGMDFSAVAAALNAFYAQYWWAILLLILVQAIGSIAILAVIGDPSRPTVGAAMERGGRFFPTALAAQLLTGMALAAAPVLAFVGGAATGSRAVFLLLLLIAIPVMVYLIVRLSLTSPAIAIERLYNPLAALARSWRLTRKSALRLFAFYLLLMVAFWVVSTVFTLILGFVLALLGEEAQIIGVGLISSLINAGFAVLAYAVLASVHRQLSRRASVPTT